jgi:SAM-dependent methyltransferase
MRLRFGYFTPEEVYQVTVDRLLAPGDCWLDVGCGRHIFPGNPDLAHTLVGRCATLVGVDPDPTLEENPFVHERVRGTIDEFHTDRTFDVVTLRMVAEHIIDPGSAVAALARLTSPGGRVVVFTPNQWSPVSLIARVLPTSLHHPIKHFLWKTEKKDTFPVAYRMNTRRRLRRLFEEHGFRAASFAYLDDCRTFANIRPLLYLELVVRSGFNAMGLSYPENCLLGVYQRLPVSRLASGTGH